MKDTWNMTPDEARKYILQNWFDGDENVNAFVCGDEEYTAMAIAVEALEATKWHYPSRGEYPKENELALCLQSDGTIPFIGIYSNNKWFNWYTKFTYEFEPKCWQYIIPPKEEATIKCCENCGHYKNNVCEITKTHPNKPKEWTCLDWKEEA